MTSESKRPPPVVFEPPPGDGYAHQLREMNDALLLSAVRQHELAEESARASRQLNESNNRFEAIFETAPFGLYVVDQEFRLRQVSLRALPVFAGIAGLIGRDFAEVLFLLWPPENARDIASRFRHTLSTGEPYVSPVFSAVRQDSKVQEHYDWQIHRLALPDGQFGVVCYFMDVGARVMAEESSRRSAERLRFVLDSMPQKIMTAMADGVIDYFNPQWTEYTGLSFEETEGRGWKQFVHPEDLAGTELLWNQCVQSGDAYAQEHRFRQADGQYCWHLSRMRAFRDTDGKILMWIGSNTDIHEQRQSADELRRYADELSEADRHKNQFLAMVAHELRNPLAPIRNAVQVLQMTSSGDESVQLAAAILDRQVTQMVRLVEDLLDINRFSLGKVALRSKLIELASVVHHAVEAVEPVRRANDQVLVVNLPQAPIFLYADPIRLTQVFENLLTNACKFTPQRGRIALTAAASDGAVTISIQDNGIGLSAEQIDRVFTLFEQVDASSSRTTGGLGIGLSLVKNLVTLHGGTVNAQSAGLGHGSKFNVLLPNVVEVPPQAPPIDRGGLESTTTARRILVVDDNRDSAQSLAVLFDWFGNETRLAFDGIEAVEAAANFRPDIILLDIGLPKISGYEVCRRIRSTKRGEDIVIIALTGMGEASDRQRALDAGFDDHIVKPVAYADLDLILAQLMNQK
ncbi:MAG: PAS domain S-box protein [Phycisphaerae bacterium]|nr:PAS domain S-box protein [Gemmatimonadaceae bacterium]